MSQIQAVILIGEPEDVVKALRDYMGKAPAVAVIEPSQMGATAITKDVKSSDALVTFAESVLNRADLAPRHKEFLKLLYDASEAGAMRAELIEAMNISSQGLQGVIGPLGRRIAHTPGHNEIAAVDGREASELLLEIRRMDNDWNYRLRRETRQALKNLGLV